MVKHGGRPGVGAVAVITGRPAGDVVARLASGDTAIMTTGAGAEHGAVVDAISGRPARTVVAVFAGICGSDMGGVLAYCCCAVVAA